MRIVYLAAGAAGSYCGACARDVGLVRGLQARGHDVLMLPLYTPLRVEGPDPSCDRVFYGGINAYLQQRFSLLRARGAGALDWLLDSTWLLRAVSGMAVETRPEKLGSMTVAVLAGRDGPQRREADKLAVFLREQEKADVVNLTNSLLSGLAPVVRDELGCPVVCHLQGEDIFLNEIGEPHRSEAWDLLRRNAESVDLFVAPSGGYAKEAAAFLGVEPERVRVVSPCVDTEVYRPAESSVRGGFRVGYLSRLSARKGADVLGQAFAYAVARAGDERLLLVLAGEAKGTERRYLKGILAGLRMAGLASQARYEGVPDLEQKIAFLRRCDVFSVPSLCAERRGMACLEAMACGVPVVLPNRGIYTELVESTGGGVLVEPDDVEALGKELLRLRADPTERDRLAKRAAAGVREHYAIGSAVTAYETVVGGLLGGVRV